MKRLWIIGISIFFAACSLIDDDLTACGEEMMLDYQLQLHTELSMQLQTELMLDTYEPVRDALESWLSPIFTDKAKDIDLRFFFSETDELQHHFHEIINDNRTSYTLQLPKKNYMHIGIANLDDNHRMQMVNANHGETMELALKNKTESASLPTGVFTARKHMEINDTSRHVSVYLYMATCAVAVVMDTTVCDSLVSMTGVWNGSAESFSVRDSVYHYSGNTQMILEEVPVAPALNKMPGSFRQEEQPNRYACIGASGFPTADDQKWSVSVTATLTGNRQTKSTLTIFKPLEAGTLRLLRVHMRGDGAVELDEENPEVGVSIELDWKDGGEHEIEI